jgi:hypothetical protein
VNRGASYSNGKIYYNTLDVQTVAVDAKTGKEAWKTSLGSINDGESITMAPVIAKNVVLVGNIRVVSGERRERLLSKYGPLSFIALLGLWAMSVILSFTLLHWTAGLRLQTEVAAPDLLSSTAQRRCSQ